MLLIIHFIIRILVICCISTPEHVEVHSLLLLLRGVVEVMKTLTAQIELIHGNLLPVILFHITVNFSRHFNDFSKKFCGLTKCL
jgi:hypothetical protein